MPPNTNRLISLRLIVVDQVAGSVAASVAASVARNALETGTCTQLAL